VVGTTIGKAGTEEEWIEEGSRNHIIIVMIRRWTFGRRQKQSKPGAISTTCYK